MNIGRSTIRKLKNRSSTILLNSLFSLTVPILNFLLYLIVLRLSSPAAWGSLVEILLVINLVMHVMAWGSTPYLLRSFSKEPSTMTRQWQEVFFSRLAFLFVPVIFLLAFYSWPLGVWLSCWLLGLFWLRAIEVFVFYTRRFLVAIISEVAGFLLLAAGILYDTYYITPLGFAQLFAVSTLLKALLMSIFFYSDAFSNLRIRLKLKYFVLAFPFTLIAITGLLHEKVDLYLMALIGTEEELGMYHVLISALILLKTGAAFILQPYVKNIYRLPLSSLKKLSRRMSLAGLAIVFFGVLALKLIIPVFFRFDFDWEVYVLGGLFTLPFYNYIIITYRLYRNNREQRVVIFSGLAIAINAILSVLLIPVYGMKGALLATTIAEWTILFVFWFYIRWKSPDV